MASLTAARKAHLLFSPNVLRRTVLCLALEASLLAAVAAVRRCGTRGGPRRRGRAATAQGAHSLAWWSLVSLLASSCCALQIILGRVARLLRTERAPRPVRPPARGDPPAAASAWRVVATRKPEQAPTVAVGSSSRSRSRCYPRRSTSSRPAAASAGQAARRGGPRAAARKVGCTSCEATVRATAERPRACSAATSASTPASPPSRSPTTLTPPRSRRRSCARSPTRGSTRPTAPRVRPPPKEIDARRRTRRRRAARSSAVCGSSCCAIQLGMNLLGLGCSGLNVWLGLSDRGPARPPRPSSRSAGRPRRSGGARCSRLPSSPRCSPSFPRSCSTRARRRSRRRPAAPSVSNSSRGHGL